MTHELIPTTPATKFTTAVQTSGLEPGLCSAQVTSRSLVLPSGTVCLQIFTLWASVSLQTFARRLQRCLFELHRVHLRINYFVLQRWIKTTIIGGWSLPAADYCTSSSDCSCKGKIFWRTLWIQKCRRMKKHVTIHRPCCPEELDTAVPHMRPSRTQYPNTSHNSTEDDNCTQSTSKKNYLLTSCYASHFTVCICQSFSGAFSAGCHSWHC